MDRRVLYKGLTVLAIFASVGLLLKVTPLGSIFQETAIDQFVKGRGFAGQVIFMAAGAVLTAIGFSRQAVAFMGGYAFGLPYGIGISLVATAIGCSLTFYYARFLGHDAIVRRFSKRIQHIDAFLSDHPFTMTLLIRFLPVGSNVLTNVAAGLSSVSGIVFVIASAIGYIPQTVIFALLGSGFNLDTWHNIGLSVLLFIASGLIGVHLYRKYRRGKRLGDIM